MDIVSYYLAHPFDSRHRMREWELEMEKKYNIVMINPFFDQDRPDMELIEDNGTTLTSLSTRETRYGLSEHAVNQLVQRDLDLIMDCDGIIAIVDGSLSYGTIQEMVYASLNGSQVLSVISNGHIGHPWLRYHSDYVFENLEKLEEYLGEQYGTKMSKV
jgi:hypothetical protein